MVTSGLRTLIRRITSRRSGWMIGLGLLGAAIHGGTAILRIDTFLPQPRLIDFGAFYAGAWALRLGESPYAWSPLLREHLSQTSGYDLPLPVLNSFPIWPWLLQPFTWLPYTSAAYAWLALNLVVLLWCVHELARLAEIRGRLGLAVLFGVALTFGPTMLTLTLGQSSLFVLALALWIGRYVSRPMETRAYFPLALLWITAIASKLFPILWAPALFALSAWRLVLGSIGAGVLFLVVHLLFLPQTSLYYVLEFLPRQTSAFVEPAFVDDQSLVAWLLRMTQAATVGASGLSAGEYQSFAWAPWWSVDPVWVRGAGAAVLIAAGLWLGRRLLSVSTFHAEPMFHVWVLYSLLVLPHTERYNHVLLLPAMAWLWSRGERGRQTAVIAYFLAALARLTHVWVQALPYPWGPLLTGSGVVAVIVLMLGISDLLSKEGSRPSAGVSV